MKTILTTVTKNYKFESKYDAVKNDEIIMVEFAQKAEVLGPIPISD